MDFFDEVSWVYGVCEAPVELRTLRAAHLLVMALAASTYLLAVLVPALPAFEFASLLDLLVSLLTFLLLS